MNRLIPCVLLLSAFPLLVQSQETVAEQDTIKYHLPPVLVTATQARDRESPVTFSDMSADHLRSVYVMHDAPSVLSELPSTIHHSWEGNDIGYSFLTMRGFDQRRIAVMINGVPQNDPEDHNVYWIDMPDLLGYAYDVQVQRGAGSMFYGPPSIGGSINVVTAPGYHKPQISLSSLFGFQEYGDRNETVLNTRKYSLSLHSGLINNAYSLYGNFSTIRSSGYRNLGWTDLRSYFVGATRFDEIMTTRIHIYGGPITHGLAYYGIPRVYNTKQLRRTNYNFFMLNATEDSVLFSTDRRRQENGYFYQPHYEVLHEWKLSPSLTLHNTVFHVRGDGAFDYDGDWVWAIPSATSWMRNYVGYDSTQTPTMLLRGFVGNTQWGWFPRLEHAYTSGTITVGGELRVHRSERWGSIQSASEYPSATFDRSFRFYEYNGQKDMFSVYAHNIYRLDEAAAVLTDVQFVYNRYGIRNEKFLGNHFDVDYFFVNPRLGLNYNFSEHHHGYVSAGYTLREPRLFNLYNGEEAWLGMKPEFETKTVGTSIVYDFDKPLLKPERLLNLELGTGYALPDGRIKISVYWMEFFDELIKSGRLDIFGRPITENAERSRHMGFELEYHQNVMEGLHLTGNVALSRNRLVRYQTFNDRSGRPETLDANPIAGFPDIVGNLRVSYSWDKARMSLLAKHVGSFYTDNFKLESRKVDSYTIFDVDAGYTLPDFFTGTSVALTGKIRNLFNTLYLASGEGDQFYPGAERSYFVGVNLTL